MVSLVGTNLQARVTSGDKFRATWELISIFGVPIADAPSQASRLYTQGALTSLGFVPVSSPTARAGDKVVVFDLRTAASMTGQTVSAVVARLEAPVPSLRLSKLEALSPTLTSGELQQGQQDAVNQGNQQASQDSLLGKATNWLSALAGKFATGAGVVVGVVVLGAIAYWYVSRER